MYAHSLNLYNFLIQVKNQDLLFIRAFICTSIQFGLCSRVNVNRVKSDEFLNKGKLSYSLFQNLLNNNSAFLNKGKLSYSLFQNLLNNNSAFLNKGKLIQKVVES